jgi:hypothetical protein
VAAVDFITKRTAPSACPHCGKLLDAVTSEQPEPPEPGDVTVCLGCATVLLFDEGMQLVLPSPAALDEILAQAPRLIDYVQAVAKVLRKQAADRRQVKGDVDDAGERIFPECCGVKMVNYAGCDEGCHDAFRCGACGKEIEVEWPH